jgi:hypothetical protein
MVQYKLSVEQRLKLREIQHSIIKAKAFIETQENAFRQEVFDIVKSTGEDPTSMEFDSDTLDLRKRT